MKGKQRIPLGCQKCLFFSENANGSEDTTKDKKTEKIRRKRNVARKISLHC